MNFNDLSGQRFGKLIVLEKTPKRNNGKVVWHCICDCGKDTFVISTSLRNGNTTSCGCYQIEKAKKDIKGLRFGKLIVICETKKRSINNSVIYKCRCDCGNEIFVDSNKLHTGNTKSCGCLHLETVIKHGHTAGYKPTSEYRTWMGMKTRCHNENTPDFKDYGGRGIRVCDEWLKFENFLAYLKANNMYPKPAGLSIDRIDNDGNYVPGNIRWATSVQQNNNQRIRRRAV